jgi:adenylyl-sulfate kinase
MRESDDNVTVDGSYSGGCDPTATSPNVRWQQSALSRSQRWEALGTRGGTVWLTGLPSSGKSTLGSSIEGALVEQGVNAYLLDGDNLRHGISSDLGFSKQDRERNVLRVGNLARLFADSGTVAVVALVSPFEETRAQVRECHAREGLPFIEVFVNTPLWVCVERDPKGLYARAMGGDLDNFTGVDDPYEEPPHAELEVTPRLGLPQAVDAVLSLLHERLGAVEAATRPIAAKHPANGIIANAPPRHAHTRDALTA